MFSANANSVLGDLVPPVLGGLRRVTDGGPRFHLKLIASHCPHMYPENAMEVLATLEGVMDRRGCETAFSQLSGYV